MRILRFAVVIAILAICFPTQAAQSNPQLAFSDETQTQTQAVQTPQNGPAQALTVPSGTVIPVSLAQPIKWKQARPGMTIRALVGAPVAADSRTAIPVGATVEGVIERTFPHRHRGPGMEIRFTRIVFANGYEMPINFVSNTDPIAQLTAPDSPAILAGATETGAAGAIGAAVAEPSAALLSARVAESTTASVRMAALASASKLAVRAQQTPPAPPTLPQIGPSKGVFIGIGIATAVGGIVALILISHRVGNTTLYDTGWRFDMVVESPLAIDASLAGVTP